MISGLSHVTEVVGIVVGLLGYASVASVKVFFFFQAEDGIRDLVRSRGLGDVYKRQIQQTRPTGKTVDAVKESLVQTHARDDKGSEGISQMAVSYTHLTLPTSDLV